LKLIQLSIQFLHLFYAISLQYDQVEVFMDFVFAGLVGLAVLGYLFYALFNPEKF